MSALEVMDLAALKEHYGVREWGQRAPLAVRLLRQVEERPDGCWVFVGAKRTPNGYGTVQVAGRTLVAHRVAFELLTAPIDAGMQLDHLCHTAATDCEGGRSCRHRLCVNPAHLEPVTARENVIRSHDTGACRNGHARTPENAYMRGDRLICRPCNQALRRRHRATTTAA